MLGVIGLAVLHHFAAFTVVACIVAEVALFKPPLTAALAQRILRIDTLIGVAAFVLIVAGLLRMPFEKGYGYYFQNALFLTKFSLFVLAALISIYPTAVYFKWNAAIRASGSAELDPVRYRRVRLCLMLELACIAGILICAPMMARGLGYLGR